MEITECSFITYSGGTLSTSTAKWDMNRSGGWADPSVFSAHGDGGFRMIAQRNGHRSPRSRLAASDEREGLVIGRARRSTGCRAWLTQALV